MPTKKSTFTVVHKAIVRHNREIINYQGVKNVNGKIQVVTFVTESGRRKSLKIPKG
jgi:hypothetical protein